ncbi:hypothetical protein, partial [Methanothrix sp.]|uniref:hypothetical protein n=1 Tax=Methanothrix sp. TaxID=90426 RepID=UPI003C7225B7
MIINNILGGLKEISIKIWLLALISLMLAISGIMNFAFAQNSASFGSPSWCATPTITVPSASELMPEIRIGGSQKSTTTSWSTSIWSFFSTYPAG